MTASNLAKEWKAHCTHGTRHQPQWLGDCGLLENGQLDSQTPLQLPTVVHTEFMPFFMVLGIMNINGYVLSLQFFLYSFRVNVVLHIEVLVRVFKLCTEGVVAHISAGLCSCLIWSVVKSKTNQQFQNIKDLLKATKNSNHLIQSCKLLLTLHRGRFY